MNVTDPGTIHIRFCSGIEGSMMKSDPDIFCRVISLHSEKWIPKVPVKLLNCFVGDLSSFCWCNTLQTIPQDKDADQYLANKNLQQKIVRVLWPFLLHTLQLNFAFPLAR